jgi:DNA-binding NarL/FixJ family response regulator
LTQREYEIATLVGNGETNKQIARRLDITERTVKAHLTEVFRKLDIADRLKLALIVKGSIYPGDSSKMSH